jgi:amidase
MVGHVINRLLMARDDWRVPHDLEATVLPTGEGLLSGLTVVVKDSFDIAGSRTGAGSPAWLDSQEPAETHAAAVARILAAGATVTGKAICDELFYSVIGANAHYGTPTNPNAPGRVPGGSSSGSASAVAAGACDFALGGDTGGSVRVPAALCGIYGIRTTHGRLDPAGTVPMAPTFDTIGWFARDPRVLRDVGRVLLDRRESRPLDRFLDAEEVLPERDDWRDAFRIVQAYEVWRSFGPFVTEARPGLGPGVRERLDFAATVTYEQAATARTVVKEARERILSLLEPGTALILPTAGGIAPRLDASPDELEEFRVQTMRLTCIAGLAGAPQVTVPDGLVDGCPVGRSYLAAPGADEALLELVASAG